MPPLQRPRLALLLAATLLLGVASRRLRLGWALWDKSFGDVLYAVAVYLVVAFLGRRVPPRTIGAVTFLLCFVVEAYQLTGVPAALARTHPWVHWFLGSTFAWHDVACYALGAALATFVVSRLGR
jgi:hypothetical protein